MLLFCGFLMFFSCQQKEKKQNTDKQTKFIKVDSSDILNPFREPSVLSDKVALAAYHDMLHTLYEKDNYKLLKKHIVNYQKLSNKSKTVKAVSNLYLGYIYNQNSKLDSAKICFEIAIQNLPNKQYDRELFLAYSGYANNYSNMQEYDSAIKMHYKAIDLLQKSKIKGKENKNYEEIANLGIDFYYVENYGKATILIDSALTYFTKKKDVKNIAAVESVKSIMLFKQQKYDESIKLAKHSLELRIVLKDIPGQAESNNNIALSYISKGKWQEALVFLEKSKSFFEKNKYSNQIPTILQNIGQCLQRLGKVDEAIQIYEQSYRLAKAKNKMNETGIALKNMAKLYKRKGNYEKSLDLYIQFSKNKDTIFNIEKEKAIQEISAKYETKQKEQKIVSLQKDNQLANQQKWISIVLVFCLLLIVACFIAYCFFRTKKSKELQESHLKLHQSEIERLRIEMEFNKQELDHFTDRLLTKSKMIGEMEEKLNVFATNHAEAQESYQISQLTQIRILTDEDWLLFKNHFDKVYTGFIPFIRKKYSNLTPAELRMLLLLKLNIESNEIASILGISPESVKKGRYRLKKKLELLEEEDLIQHIQNLVF